MGNFAKPTPTDLDGLLEMLVGEDTGTILRYEQKAAIGTDALLFSKTTKTTRYTVYQSLWHGHERGAQRRLLPPPHGGRPRNGPACSTSPVVTLAASTSSTSAAQPAAYPIIFTNELNVTLPGTAATQAATVALLTAAGRPVCSCPVQLGTAPQALAELPTLAAGTYFLRIAAAAVATKPAR